MLAILVAALALGAIACGRQVYAGRHRPRLSWLGFADTGLNVAGLIVLLAVAVRIVLDAL